MAYQEVSTKYPSMINSFAQPDTLTKLIEVIPVLAKPGSVGVTPNPDAVADTPIGDTPNPDATPEPVADTPIGDTPNPDVSPNPDATPEPVADTPIGDTPNPDVSPNPDATPEPVADTPIGDTPNPDAPPEPVADTPIGDTPNPEPVADTPNPDVSSNPDATPEPVADTPNPDVSSNPDATPEPIGDTPNLKPVRVTPNPDATLDALSTSPIMRPELSITEIEPKHLLAGLGISKKMSSFLDRHPLDNKPKQVKNDQVTEVTLNKPPSSDKLEEMKSDVKPISSLLKEKSKWNFQKEKNGSLQHQCDSHRAYLYDHRLTKFNEKQNNVQLTIDRIPKINYFKFITKNKDTTNEMIDNCKCNEYEEIIKCYNCKKLRNEIASRSIGQKYEDLNLPKWNLTFMAGGLRSENRVYYGTYHVRAKSNLNSNCQSFITFSMMLPIKDPNFPKLGYWEEIALGFSSKNSTALSLFIKSSLSSIEKPQVVIPIEIKTPGKKFNVKEYNDYTLVWEKDKITLSVNSKKVYTTKPNHPVPRLPGYSYFIIRPNYDTDSVELIKNIKKELWPNMYIKSFSYTPLD